MVHVFGKHFLQKFLKIFQSPETKRMFIEFLPIKKIHFFLGQDEQSTLQLFSRIRSVLLKLCESSIPVHSTSS